jgi:prepilin-type N-terminal cleavage/methylation domain-containing protein
MRCPQLRSPAPRAAFTLIELLIVMGIIAVLVAITLPAIMKAREAANRTTCISNLHNMGVACEQYYLDFGYFPTAGYIDFAAPIYPAPVVVSGKVTTGANPVGGWQQQGGWAYQLLPYMGEDVAWVGGGYQAQTASASTLAAAQASQVQQMEESLRIPFKFYFCPSRRSPNTNTYAGSVFPNYSIAATTNVTASMIDYAGCNGGVGSGGSGNGPNTGVVRTQSAFVTSGGSSSWVVTRNTVKKTDIKDGLPYTILIAEKAANPRYFPIANEDDGGYALGYSGGTATTAANLNSIRFAFSSLMPLRDGEVNGPTGGAFGSAHPGTWNALMADLSVQQLSYTMSPTIFSYLGNINDGNTVTANDIAP